MSLPVLALLIIVILAAGYHLYGGFVARQYRLDPGAGTLLNLGDCYEKSGRTASGWAAFREAVAVAHRTGLC